jgi:membrane-associated PAP2 superfamily phosphatase
MSIIACFIFDDMCNFLAWLLLVGFIFGLSQHHNPDQIIVQSLYAMTITSTIFIAIYYIFMTCPLQKYQYFAYIVSSRLP